MLLNNFAERKLAGVQSFVTEGFWPKSSQSKRFLSDTAEENGSTQSAGCYYWQWTWLRGGGHVWYDSVQIQRIPARRVWLSLPQGNHSSFVATVKCCETNSALMMTSAEVVETSVSVTNNSHSLDYSHPDDQTTQTTETPGFKPFTETTSIIREIRRNVKTTCQYHSQIFKEAQFWR